jgi:hypothetical protein
MGCVRGTRGEGGGAWKPASFHPGDALTLRVGAGIGTPGLQIAFDSATTQRQHRDNTEHCSFSDDKDQHRAGR